MAIKTFTTGETLTTSDTNTYLTNSGLVYIKEFSSNAVTLFIDSCFTSTFDNYVITLQCTNVSATGSFMFRLRSGGTANIANYVYGGLTYLTNAANTVQQSAGDTSIVFTAATTNSIVYANLLVSRPNATQATPIMIDSTALFSNYAGASIRGYHNVATAFDGFQITSNTGATINGILRVYGVRQA